MMWILVRVKYPDDRKLCLLASRFVRETRVDDTSTVWDLLTDERSRRAVEVAEQYAVGEATERGAAWGTARAAEWVAQWVASAAASAVASAAAEWAAARVSALAQQAEIIRDMIPVEEIVPLFERYIERLQTLQGESDQ